MSIRFILLLLFCYNVNSYAALTYLVTEENSVLHEKAYKMAMEDALTGLGSRHRMQIEGRLLFNTANRSQSNISFAMIDIDFFKKVNDEFGHPAGDYVLHEVAQTMTNVMRNCDVVARYGGEEFAIILPETAASSAKVLAQRVRRSIEQLNIQHEEHSIPVTISCGICSCDFSTSTMTRSEFINYSDQALYKAKESGRNRVEI